MCRLGSNPCSLCFPGQEQPKPSSSGSRSILLLLHSNPGPSSEPKYGGALAPVPPLQAPPEPAFAQAAWRQVPVQPPKAAGGGCGGVRAGLHPSSPIPDAAAWGHMHPQASLPPSPLLLRRGCRGDPGGDRAERPPPTHTHIPAALPFGVAVAGEFQLFQHLYLFWLQFLFWPHYKLKAALLLTSSKLHLLTSLPRLLAGRGLLLAGADALALEVCRKPASPFLFFFFFPPSFPTRHRVPTKAPCKRSLSSLMDDVAARRLEPGSRDVSTRGLSQPPGWH